MITINYYNLDELEDEAQDLARGHIANAITEHVEHVLQHHPNRDKLPARIAAVLKDTERWLYTSKGEPAKTVRKVWEGELVL